MIDPRFLDSNVPLRAFVNTNADMTVAAQALLRRLEERAERAIISLVVVLEVVFTLERTYKQPKSTIRDMVGALIALPSIQLADKRLCLEALDLYVERNISFGDAYNVAFMKANGIAEVYSCDTDLDRAPDIRRITPSAH